MQFTTLISAISLAAVSLMPAVSADMKFVGEFGGPAGQGLRFQTKLRDNKVWYLSVYDTLILTPKAPSTAAWYFRKTDKESSLDTLYYKPDNRLATYVKATDEFQLRKTDQLAKGWWNLTTPPQHLKFSDSTDFRVCEVYAPLLASKYKTDKIQDWCGTKEVQRLQKSHHSKCSDSILGKGWNLRGHCSRVCWMLSASSIEEVAQVSAHYSFKDCIDSLDIYR
jgi:hypothetical protein